MLPLGLVPYLWSYTLWSAAFMSGEKLLLVAVWILPVAVMAANVRGLPLAPLVLTGFLAVLLARIYGWVPKPARSRSVPRSA